MGKTARKWLIKNSSSSFSSIKEIVDLLLENRDLHTIQEKQGFISPSHPHDISFSSLGLETETLNKFLHTLKRVHENHSRIFIYGDYDADGICSTAILWEALNRLGFDVIPYIPNRFEDGYGLRADIVLKHHAETPIALVITVDNGIVAHKEIEILQNVNIPVVVSDHHQAGETLPSAFLLFHTTKLCGSGIAYFLAREIYTFFDSSDRDVGLDLAAIGTIADQVPLLEFNRSLALHGIVALQSSKRPGISALCSVSGIDQSRVGSYEIGFLLAPRINAMGRLSHGIESLRLLCTPKSSRALELAYLLQSTNLKRQDLVSETVEHVRTHITQENPSIIVVSSSTYNEGIIGLAASALVEEYYRPSIVFSLGETVAKASARSIEGFNIISAIREAGKELLLSGGGHEMAAGFSLLPSNIALFQERIESIGKSLDPSFFEKKLSIDCYLPLSFCTLELEEALRIFEPTGMKNHRPVFATNDVLIQSVFYIGKQKQHAKLIVSDGTGTATLMVFRYEEYGVTFSKKTSLSISYTLSENVWNGVRELQLIARDVKA